MCYVGKRLDFKWEGHRSRGSRENSLSEEAGRCCGNEDSGSPIDVEEDKIQSWWLYGVNDKVKEGLNIKR